jgi:excisionase family DNA binding protein
MLALTTTPTRPPRPPRLPVAPRRRSHHFRGVLIQPQVDVHERSLDVLLTADEVAQLLRVTKAWVYAETRAKRIPHVPLGRYVRYRRSAVLAWIDAIERT